MRIQDEAFARYHETHEGHVNPQGKVRDEWALDFFQHYFVPHIPTQARHDVLDIGCGDGAMLRAFRKMGFAAWGTDLDPRNCGKKKRVIRHDVLKEPFKSLKFDIIVFMGVIEHIPKDDLLPSLRNIRKMLRPGGAVFVTTQNMDSLMGDHFRYLDITHELGFTRESLCQVARLAGFEPEVYPFYSTPPKREPGLKGLVKRLWRAAYRYHVRVVDPVRYSTWWEADGLLGVWR